MPNEMRFELADERVRYRRMLPWLVLGLVVTSFFAMRLYVDIRGHGMALSDALPRSLQRTALLAPLMFIILWVQGSYFLFRYDITAEGITWCPLRQLRTRARGLRQKWMDLVVPKRSMEWRHIIHVKIHETKNGETRWMDLHAKGRPARLRLDSVSKMEALRSVVLSKVLPETPVSIVRQKTRVRWEHPLLRWTVMILIWSLLAAVTRVVVTGLGR